MIGSDLLCKSEPIPFQKALNDDLDMVSADFFGEHIVGFKVF